MQPTVSYRFNEQLSIGFGPTINRIDGQLESAALNRTSPGTADGRVKVKGDDTALGFNAGVLLRIFPADPRRDYLPFESQIHTRR